MRTEHVVLTFSMDMWHGHSAWTCSTDTHWHVAWAFSMNMQQGHAAWTCSMDIWTFNMDMRHGHSAHTCSKDMQPGHAPKTWSKDMRQGHASWTCSKDMRQGHAARRRKYSYKKVNLPPHEKGGRENKHSRRRIMSVTAAISPNESNLRERGSYLGFLVYLFSNAIATRYTFIP